MKLTRRNFLKSAAATSLASAIPYRAVAASSFFQCDDKPYKALIAINFNGGNDGFNMFVPTLTEYAEYESARGALALKQDKLLPLHFEHGQTEIGLHPSLSDILWMFDQGIAAPIINMGPLIEPVTKSNMGDKRLPPKMYAHNYQSQIVQTHTDEYFSTQGWGAQGLYYLLNSLSDSVPMYSMTTSTNTWANSTQLTAGVIGPSLPSDLELDDVTGIAEFRDALLTAGSKEKSAYAQYHSDMVEDATQSYALYKNILNNNEDLGFPNTDFGNQCKRAFLLIRDHQVLGQNRQCFALELGGFDTHSDQLRLQGDLFSDFAQSISALYTQLRNIGLEEAVTSFTFSEFGRTVEPNNSGTDHGWGSNAMVFGGDINGGQYFGQWPSLALDGDNSLSRGRMIPEIATDQLHASILQWFGVSGEAIDIIFPHIHNFEPALLPVFGSCQPGSGELEIASVYASAENPNGTGKASYAIDGNDETKWSAKGIGVEYTLNLTKPSYVESVRFKNAKGNERSYFMEWQVSADGRNFAKITDTSTPGNTDSWVTVPLNRSSIVAVRAVCRGNDDSQNPSLREWNNFSRINLIGSVL